MAKDYAKRRSSKPKTKGRRAKKGAVSRWLWLVIIILLGGFAVFLLIISRAPNKQAALEALAPSPAITSVKSKETPKSMPKFEFYDILPEKQIMPPKVQEKTPPPVSAPVSTYWVQIAAFPNFVDADALKAELALMGFPASIESVTLDGQSWFRVRSGPFATEAEAQNAQAQLQAADISSQVMAD